MLLAHHPDLATLGEFMDNRERRFREGEGDFCSCGEKLASCPFMAELVNNLAGKGIDFSVDFPDTAFLCSDNLTNRILRAYVRGPLFENLRKLAIALIPQVRSTLQRIINRNRVVISTVLAMENATMYLDSAKNNNRVLYFDRYASDFEVKVIWLIRDGRGVVNSIMKHYEIGLEEAVTRWATAQKSVMRTAAALSRDQLMVLRYEDFCNDPGRWLPETCRFLGLDPDLMPGSFTNLELHLTGNNMRLKGLGEIRIDEKWKATLSASDLAYFEAQGGALNRELGY